MTAYTDRFGGSTVQPSDVGFRAVALSASITTVWPSFATAANECARIMKVSASAGSLTITLPDATLAATGQDVLFDNSGAETFTVLDSAGGSVCTLTAGQVKYLYLSDNSTAAGTWRVTLFGASSSNLDASQLAGYGLKAISNTINAAPAMTSVSGDTTVVAADRAKIFLWEGGSGTLTLPTTVGSTSDFHIEVRNQGSGTVTVQPVGGVLIDGSANIELSVNESCFVHMGVTDWSTVGRGRNTAFNFTRLSKVVDGGTDTLSLTEASSVVQTYTGALLSNQVIEVPAVVQVYYISNGTTGSYTLGFKCVTGGSATVTVLQGQAAILFCDGSTVINANTSVSGITTIVFGAGSAAVPSVAIANSATGFYASGTNEIGVSLNGVFLGKFAAGGLTLDGLTASSAVATDASKKLVSVTNTGTGNNVLATSPTLVTPTLGVAAATSVNKVTLTAPATGSTLTIADGKTFTANDNVTVGTGGITLGNSGGLSAAASQVLTVSNSITLSGSSSPTLAVTGTSTVSGANTGDQTNISGNAATASAVAVGGITGLGTGVATALAVNVGSAGAPVVLNGAGGTPSSITLTNATGTAASLTAGLASGLTGTPNISVGTVTASGAVTVGAGGATVGQTIVNAGMSDTVSGVSTGSLGNVTRENKLLSGYGYYNAGTPLGNVSIRSSYDTGTYLGNLRFYVSDTGYTEVLAATITSTGLAVTGALSATGEGTISGITVGKGSGAVATNTAIGHNALLNNTTGAANTAVGTSALQEVVTGVGNTSLGWRAGYLTTSDSGTFIGYNAGSAITTGGSNVIVGGYTGNMDGLDIRTASNYAVIADGEGNRLLTTKNGYTLALDGASVPNSGTGITFPATQNASADANTLDDYEEGTWTPVITCATPPTTPFPMSVDAAKYNKTGNHVTVIGQGVATVSANLTGASGDVRVTGLPFATAINAISGSLSSSDFASNNPSLISAQISTSYLNLAYKTSTTAVPSALQSTDLSTGAYNNVVTFTNTYLA